MTTYNAKFDPILLEVLKNGFETIADEMAFILMRAAHSTVVRDSMDFSTAICDAQGRTLAQGVTTPMHLGSFPDAMSLLIERYRDSIKPGDIFIGNDPYEAAGQHLPDVYIVKPIFDEAKLIGWATSLAHQADFGGIVAGSNAIGATEIYQEGLRLPFIKLADGGVYNQAIWDVIAINVRVPDLVLGDLKAEIAACIAGERGYLELYRRYGEQTITRYIEELHDYAERLARAEIEEIPDGVYRFQNHIDGFGENPEPITFQVTITVAGDSFTADWTGTSPQVLGGINTPIPFTKAAVYAALRSVMNADIPNCDGFNRAVTVVAPAGTVVNSVHPAPCGSRGITGYRCIDCMFGALAQAVPDRVAADNMGGSTVPTFSGYRDGGEVFVFCETFMGTWGGTPTHDGPEGVPHIGANQSNVPIELIESNFPLRIVRYGIVPDTGGPGKYRGGHALCRDYEVLQDNTMFSVRSDKRDHPPHGLKGGSQGSPSMNIIERNGERRILPTLMTEPIRLNRGDVFRHVMASGGGYGDPMERDVELVAADVREETLTRECALRDYGVAFSDGGELEVDQAATNLERSKRVSERALAE